MMMMMMMAVMMMMMMAKVSGVVDWSLVSGQDEGESNEEALHKVGMLLLLKTAA